MSRSPPLRASYAHLYFPRQTEKEEENPGLTSVPAKWESFWSVLKDKEIQRVAMIFGAGVIILAVIQGIIKIVCLALSSSKKPGSVIEINGTKYVPVSFT